MKIKISLEKIQNDQTGECTVIVQNSASKEDAIELLAIGTRNIMEQMGITLTEYLEALMEAREISPDRRIIVDASHLANSLPENQDQ